MNANIFGRRANCYAKKDERAVERSAFLIFIGMQCPWRRLGARARDRRPGWGASGGASSGRWTRPRAVAGAGCGGEREPAAGMSAPGSGSAPEHLRGCRPGPDPSWAHAGSGVCGTEDEEFGLSREDGFPGKGPARRADRREKARHLARRGGRPPWTWDPVSPQKSAILRRRPGRDLTFPH